MHKSSIALLGVSFDNVGLDEAAQKVLPLISAYAKDGSPRYVATINVDFLVKAHSISWNHVIDPELLSIYRRSHMVVCDGMPLIWLSRLLGSRLKERVTGADLIPQLSGLLSLNNRSLFLLGGQEHINKVTGVILEALYSGLRIAGRASPTIYTEGESLLGINEQDSALVEEINRTAPDVLLVALGNPKQEKWFNRAKRLLKVPVSVGVGGAFDIISGALPRAPAWMQKGGLEWLYRLFQEPRRLWKRYAVDIWKFLAIAAPLVVYHTISRVLYRMVYKRKNRGAEMPLLFLSSSQTIAIVPLPSLIDEEYCHLVYTSLDETFNQDTVILDFGNVRHITLEGFSLLLKIWLKALRGGKELYAMNISGDIKVLMKVHRLWDLVKDSVMDNPQKVLRALIQGKSHPSYFDSIQQHAGHLAIYFFGAIGGAQNSNSYIEKMAPLLREKDCVLDFRYCTSIDNGGFSFLLKLKKIVALHKHTLYVRKRSRSIRQLFLLNEVDDLFLEYRA